MTVKRNANYIADAATQTAKRIDDLLISSENSIGAIAHMYELSLDPSYADVETLDKLTESTVFDYIGFVNSEGIYTDNRGFQADVSDRDYVQDGLRGNCGIDVIFNGRVSNEDLVIFYAPLQKGDNVVGVLTGRYRPQQMKEIITTSYFGEPASTYLCLSDGTVIAASVDIKPANILDTLNQNDDADKEAVAVLADALATGKSVGFTYTTSYGSSAAYVTELPHSGWMLLQVFPMQVTNEMLDETSTAATYLLLWLLVLSTIYILLLLLENSKEKKQLTSEKQQIKEIVNSTSRLFDRFIVIDLEHDTYTLLTNDDLADSGHIPAKGVYSKLLSHRIERTLNEAGDAQVNELLSARSIQRDLTQEVPYLQYENRTQEDGHIRWWQICVLCLKRKDGVAASVLMTVQDVTELKERERHSRAALEDAYQSAQAANEVKRTFLFDMSHDMRTPMNAIIGLSSLLDRDAADPERVRSYSKKINASGQQLLSIINKILDMSKIESGNVSLNLVPFSLSELLEELFAVYQPQAQNKSQGFEVTAFDIPEDRLIGDKLRLSEMLGNLLSNAIRYTAKGGKIALNVKRLEQVTPGFVRLRFTVADNGIGMDPEFVQHVFEPFTRESNSTVSGIQGTGLGMTIAKSLVDLMGGTICVESVQGQGTAFTVELEFRPAEEGNVSGFWKENDIRNTLALGSDENICKSICKLLDGTGIKSHYATDIREVAALAGKTNIDLILLDRALPGMDALESIRRIRALCGSSPALILIDNDWIEREDDARDAGANAFLPAPFALSTLQEAVGECGRRQTDRPPYHGEANASLEGLRALVVEDNDINAEILMELLGMEGITCDRVTNGREAVTLFQGKPVGYYHAVLMDIQMPEMNGHEATRAIRSLNRPDAATVPIVAMTANAFADDVQKSMESGMNAHIAKPVDPAVLKSTLLELIG